MPGCLTCWGDVVWSLIVSFGGGDMMSDVSATGCCISKAPVRGLGVFMGSDEEAKQQHSVLLS